MLAVELEDLLERGVKAFWLLWVERSDPISTENKSETKGKEQSSMSAQWYKVMKQGNTYVVKAHQEGGVKVGFRK